MNDINTNKKALIAMSGGVDSSVAAYAMQEAGFDCLGCTMKLTNRLNNLALDDSNSCVTDDNIRDARAVCDRLNIDHYVADFSDNFKEKVVDYFVGCYECGITPNPCIECNRYLKFEKLFEKAEELGCEYVVTGHYAVVTYDEKSGRYLLQKGSDTSKDQSYFLYKLTQEQLAHVKLPLAELSKDKTRQIAESQGLATAEKKDSQDICFVANGKYVEFIESYTGKEYPEGDFIDINGKVLGRHKGIIRYTIGQRKGLGIALNEPMYVKEVNVDNNTVMLARDEELYSSELIAKDINLISVEKIAEPMEVMAKIRYRHNPAQATVTQISENEIKVVFKEPQRAITRGQAVVLYDGDTVVGGGTIC